MIVRLIDFGFYLMERFVFLSVPPFARLIAPVFSAWIGCPGSRVRLAVGVVCLLMTAGVATTQSSAEAKRIDRLEAVVEKQSDNIQALQMDVAKREFAEIATSVRLTALESQATEIKTGVAEARGGITVLQWLWAIASVALGLLIKGKEIRSFFRGA